MLVMVSYVELLILYELWAGERLSLKRLILVTSAQDAQFQCRLFLLVQDIDIWRSCRYNGALFRALVGLLGGIRRFVSCDVGAHHCKLRHIGWERMWSWPYIRPRESASEGFLKQLLVLFGYPLWFCCCVIGWSVTLSVTALVVLHVGFPLGVFLLGVMFSVLLLSVLVLERFRGAFTLIVLSCLAWLVVLEFSMVGESLWALKEVDYTEKIQHTFAGFGRDVSSQSRPRVWKRLRLSEGSQVSFTMVPRFRRCTQGSEAHGPQDRVGAEVGNLGLRGPTSPGSA